MEKDLRTHKLIGTAMEVHIIIGSGHLEAVSHECLEIEFENRKIPFVSKPQLAIYYKERKFNLCVYNNLAYRLQGNIFNTITI